MPQEDDADERDEEVYKCEYCGEEVGTPGGEPTEDCPTCGRASWDALVTTDASGSDNSSYECPNCKSTEDTVEVWESPADAETGTDPDYIGCTACNEMTEFDG